MEQPVPAPGVIEVLDAPAAAGHAAGVLARLAERDQQRAVEAARRLEELEVTSEPRENVDRFLETFAAQRQELEAQLEATAGAAGGAAAADGGSSASGGDAPAANGGGPGAAAELAALAERIADLEKLVADAAYFLPPYDLRQATLALAALRERQEAAAAALQPRKRFAFNRKAPKPAAGGTAAAGQAAAAAGGAAGRPQPESQQQQAGAADAGDPADGQQPPAAQPSAPSQATASGSQAASTISGLRGQVLCLGREEAEGREFTLSDLQDCSIFLLAPLAALFLHGLRLCRLFTGPVAGACFVEEAEDCVLMIAAQQVRIHSAARTDFYLRVRSHPIIEHSASLRFAPYAPAYPGAAADLAGQGLESEGGMWRQVNDFGWLRATPSPHWSELPEGERQAAPAGPPEEAAGAAAVGGRSG